jgi:DNA polymerase III subunit epsilon
MLARDLNPGARVSLDALCRYYGIDNSKRTLHGALLDSQILAEVYLELIGGRQVALTLITEPELPLPETVDGIVVARVREVPLLPRITNDEIAAHLALVASLGAEALWGEYLDEALAA